MSNKERFAKRQRNVKAAWSIVTLISIVITVVCICQYAATYDGGYLFGALFSGATDVVFIIFWICTLVGVKFHSYIYNGHEISLYLGWSCAFLIVDDEIVDKHTGSFFGARPLEYDLNGEKLSLTVGSFTLNNYTLRAGSKILH